MQDLYISPENVVKKLNALKISKSPGPDGLHPRVLKEVCSEISQPLSLIMNKSLKEGVLPQTWKDAHVSPILKKA
jgi:hypothetical protein